MVYLHSAVPFLRRQAKLWWRLRQLRSNNDSTCLRALSKIHSSADASLVEAIVDLLGANNDQVVKEATKVLINLGEYSLEPLSMVLKHNDKPVQFRLAAVGVLRNFDSPLAT